MTRAAIVFASFALLLCVAGCIDITHVQTGYVADRNSCRAQSENGMGVYTGADGYPLSDKERNNALLQLFCECMRDKDWKVAGCPKPVEIVKIPQPTPPPTVVVVQQPAAAAAPAAEPAEEPQSCPAPLPGHKRKHRAPNGACVAPPDDSAPQQTPATQQLDTILQKQ
jgi:hypothetical protein